MGNLLLQTDVYKFSHKDQYPPTLNRVYSYLESRGTREAGLDFTVFFGLQYYLQKYLTCPTHADVDEFLEVAEGILGTGTVDLKQMRELVDLGYLPIHIRAVPEGTVVTPLSNALLTITNTHPGFGWLVNYLETLLMKLWSPITVASNSLRFRRLFEKYASDTCDNVSHVPFQMHDFGYRGCSSEESAAIAGAAHLTSFMGTDTTAAVKLLKDYYLGEHGQIGLSVPASEHSVMCSWSKENDDFPAIENMLRTYPTGIVSIVSDTYNLWDSIERGFAGEFRSLVEQRNGKVVIRPDSGDPLKILCGDVEATGPAATGVIRLLDQHFGSTVNAKGYRVLNPKVGTIYGDASFYSRADEILATLQRMGYASSNVVFGSGGLLLNNWSRDTLKMAIKASYCEIGGVPRDIEKRPITDVEKKSKKGRLRLNRREDGTYYTEDQCNGFGGCLQTVYRNGGILPTTLSQIRSRIK